MRPDNHPTTATTLFFLGTFPGSLVRVEVAKFALRSRISVARRKMLTQLGRCDRRTESSFSRTWRLLGFAAMLGPLLMDPAQQTEESRYTDGRSISGKMFVVIFLAISVALAGSVTIMRVSVRPKYEAAVASSSAKAAALDAQRATAATSAKPAKPAEPTSPTKE